MSGRVELLSEIIVRMLPKPFYHAICGVDNVNCKFKLIAVLFFVISICSCVYQFRKQRYRASAAWFLCLLILAIFLISK